MEKASFEKGSTGTYVLGFVVSLILTLGAFFLVSQKLMSGWPLILTISTLAIVQAFVQLVLFLHLGQESKPRRNLLVFLFMAMVIVIVVGGTLWIMANLNDNTMLPMNMQHQAGL